jgi:F0F1-type ATP synthase assembly protein I
VQGESEPEASPPREPTRQVAQRPRGLRGADASLLGLGTQMMSEVAAGVLLGLGADYLLDTKNRWVVVGSITGVVVAMWTLVRVAMRLQRADPMLRKRGAREPRAKERQR